MPGYIVSQCTLDEHDLKEKVFDEKWKTTTKFVDFENAVNTDGEMNDMKKWIYEFDAQLLNIYELNTIGKFTHNQDKRCRDLNYYINYVLHYIPKITKKTENSADIIDSFEHFLKGIFKNWEHLAEKAKFKCKRTEKAYQPTMYLIKKLDDYCENKKNFEKKLQSYDYKTCCKYANHVNETRSSFNNYILNGVVNKDDRDFYIDDKCALKNSGETFPNVKCNENNMFVSKSDELPIAVVNGYLSNYQQHTSPETHPVGTFNSSPTKIALTSVSTLLGACVSGLYLYRNSFVGSMLRNFQNRNRISNEDTYDDVNGMFSEGVSHYLDNLQENNRFHIAYDPMNN
ncbi:PIR Superfamily Protein [Plasmodium ovale curtisi]|uniref:PIR Superfamily Protein n=1 Tax=Plasmodium ovale curtisi TaxID=864141 RepID=A0A1A8XBD8_PLAOA|nr:PIR Superfamily Protein [Plasmodium ovale curtisi]